VRGFFWRLQRHARFGDDVSCLKLLLPKTPVTKAQINALIRELRTSAALREALNTPEVRGWLFPGEPRNDPDERLRFRLTGAGRVRALFLYVTARLQPPTTVVETGCATGWDTALILLALERNGGGKLYSIDIPAQEGQFSQLGPGQGLPEGLEPGAMVPAGVRHRWSLIIGNTRLKLPPLLQELGNVDLFFHDSDHTYPHMMWEYTTVWPHLASQGLLISDDISWNTAFRDFARGTGRGFAIHRRAPNLGGICRESNGANELPRSLAR
jgi:predicted O-methyltransferase YrrM